MSDAPGGEVKGKLANAVGSQYPSHYLGTWCIQHYYRWCAHLGCQQSTELTPSGRVKWTRPFRWKTNFVSVINQLDAHNFCFTISLFHASTCFEHMCSSSGGQIALHSLWYHHTVRCTGREITAILSQPVHQTATYRCDGTRGCVMQFWPPDDEHMCSKHVGAWNKLIVKQKICVSSWLITEINILRCTVSKTSKDEIWFLRVCHHISTGLYLMYSFNHPIIKIKTHEEALSNKQ